MAVKTWEILKVTYCDRAGCDVSLEAEVIYPADHLPDKSARVVAHRCSKGTECNAFEKLTCVWSGTNPSYDPLTK